jgi:hypothetical protein
LADRAVIVPSQDTQRVQEVQSLLFHVICELVEERLFGAGEFAAPIARLRPPNVREFEPERRAAAGAARNGRVR